MKKSTISINKESIEKASQQNKLIKYLKNYKIQILIVILILFCLGYLLKTQLVVATVNGSPIWRYTLVKELENKAGKSALDSMLTQKLIEQEAGKQNITVSPEEIDSQYASIEAQFSGQGQDFNQLMASQGTNAVDLKNQIKVQRMLEKLVGTELTISDEEAQKYFDENSTYFPDQEFETVKDDIKAQLKQEQTSTKVNDYISSLKTEAKIVYYKNY